MKKTLFIFITLFVASICNAQNFPYYDVQLLVGKKLKVLEQNSLKEYGYDNFYKDSKLEKKYACCQSYNSKYEELVGKEFTVVSYEKYIKTIGSLVDTMFKLKLSNDTTGIIYYKYNPKYEHDFVFKVLGGLDFPLGFFCKFITNDIDKFTKKTTYRSEMVQGMRFIKVIDNDKITYYMYILQKGSTLNIGEKGVILLFDNGLKIEKINALLDVKVTKYGYDYTAFIELDDTDIKLLLTNVLTDRRLYIYDGIIKKDSDFLLKEYLKCLTK